MESNENQSTQLVTYKGASIILTDFSEKKMLWKDWYAI